MRYLVIAETVDNGAGMSPAELVPLMENVVLPSMQTLKEWDDSGKIRGGLMSGRRGTAFVVDAASNEELSDMIRQLPVWGTAEVEITPLDSFAHRITADGEATKAMKSM